MLVFVRVEERSGQMEFRVQSSEFRVQSSEFRVQSLEFRASKNKMLRVLSWISFQLIDPRINTKILLTLTY